MRAAGNKGSGKGQLSEADGTFRGKIEYIRELVFLETSFRGLHGEKGSGGSGMIEKLGSRKERPRNTGLNVHRGRVMRNGSD